MVTTCGDVTFDLAESLLVESEEERNKGISRLNNLTFTTGQRSHRGSLCGRHFFLCSSRFVSMFRLKE